MNDIISVRGLNDNQTTRVSVYLRGDEGWLIRAKVNS